MKFQLKGNKFLIILFLLALTIVLIFMFFLKPTTQDQIELNEVDYTKNVLVNSEFEKGSISPWKIDFIQSNQSYAYLDDIVKLNGKLSLNITSDAKEDVKVVSQELTSISPNKKYILNGYIKTENVDRGFLRLELLNSKDSLIAFSDSDTLKGINDWTFVTTWGRTINPEVTKLKVKLILEGSGRIWFDNLELFPVEINRVFFFPSKK